VVEGLVAAEPAAPEIDVASSMPKKPSLLEAYIGQLKKDEKLETLWE
jgi:hypothetical protein